MTLFYRVEIILIFVLEPKMKQRLDHGWAWIILISVFLSSIITGCLGYSAGVFNVALLEKFEANVATTALIGSIHLGLMFFAGSVASVCINRFSCRVTNIIGGGLTFIGFTAGFFVNKLEIYILTNSILGGTGIGFCYTVISVVLGFNFKKYLGVVIGLAMAGIGCGIFISGPFCQYLIDSYGLQGAYMVLGGIALNQVVFGMLMRPSPTEEFQKLEKLRNREQKSNLQKSTCNVCELYVFKNLSFVFILICAIVWTTPHSIVVLHLPNFAVVRGFSPESAAWLITVHGIGSTLNRLLTGLSVGPEGLDPLLLFMGSNGLLGLLLLTFTLYSSTYVGQVVFSFIYGVYTGGLYALRSPLCLRIVELQQFSTAVGLILTLEGTGYFIGPPIAGLIMDYTGSYEYSFFLSGALFITNFFLSMMSSIWWKKQKKPDIKQDIEETHL